MTHFFRGKSGDERLLDSSYSSWIVITWITCYEIEWPDWDHVVNHMCTRTPEGIAWQKPGLCHNLCSYEDFVRRAEGKQKFNSVTFDVLSSLHCQMSLNNA